MEHTTNQEINIAIAERLFFWGWYSVYPRTLDCNAIDINRRVKMLAMTENTPNWGPYYGIRDPFQATIKLKYDVREGFGASMEPELLAEKDWSDYPRYGDEPGHIKEYYIGSFSNKHEGFCWDYFVPNYVERSEELLSAIEQASKNTNKINIAYTETSKKFSVKVYRAEEPLSIFHRSLKNVPYIGEDSNLARAICVAISQLDLRK